MFKCIIYLSSYQHDVIDQTSVSLRSKVEPDSMIINQHSAIKASPNRALFSKNILSRNVLEESRHSRTKKEEEDASKPISIEQLQVGTLYQQSYQPLYDNGKRTKKVLIFPSVFTPVTHFKIEVYV